MDSEKLKLFLTHCEHISDSLNRSFFKESDDAWPIHRQNLYINGVIQGLYREQDETLLELISQPCDHKELSDLLQMEVDEYRNSEMAFFLKKRNHFSEPPEIREPLLQWIADYNYGLAAPMFSDGAEMAASASPEETLSYVYLVLSYKFKEKIDKKGKQYSFQQPYTEALYKPVFDKASVFKTWGLLPIDGVRKLYSVDDPVRLYDSDLDKTVFLNIPRPLAEVLDKLYKEKRIKKLAIRSKDDYIFNGENHVGQLCEAVEKGRVFSWKLDKLPDVTKLYREEFYEDCLWIKSEGDDITFEELCGDFHDDGENVITQMIHLQHTGAKITHLDHEYIFYDVESYEARMKNAAVKGEGRKRVKTFKIDQSDIPMDYPCRMYKDDKEILVPFIFLVLDNYFEHKELLDEYFQKIL